MRKIVQTRTMKFVVAGYGEVECTQHGGRFDELSFYFASLALTVGAPSLDEACAFVDAVVAREREQQMADSMW